jgi:hypothetical protein
MREYEAKTANSLTLWYNFALITDEDHQEIEQVNSAGELTDHCMQLDHARGNTVIQAACNGKSYQEWEKVYIGLLNGEGQFDEYRSDWDRDLCLSYNAAGHDIYVRGCSKLRPWWQQFGEYVGP